MWKVTATLQVFDHLGVLETEDMPSFLGLEAFHIQTGEWTSETGDENSLVWSQCLQAEFHKQIDSNNLQKELEKQNPLGFEIFVLDFAIEKISSNTKPLLASKAQNSSKKHIFKKIDKDIVPGYGEYVMESEYEKEKRARTTNSYVEQVFLRYHIAQGRGESLPQAKMVAQNILQSVQKVYSGENAADNLFVDGPVKDGIVHIEKSYDPPIVYSVHIPIDLGTFAWKNKEYYDLCRALSKLPMSHPIRQTEFVQNFFHHSASFGITLHTSTYENNLALQIKAVLGEEIPEESPQATNIRKQFLQWILSNQTRMVIHESQYISDAEGTTQDHVCLSSWTLSSVDEKSMLQLLQQQGADIEHNLFDMPEYDSWTDVRYGYKFVLQKPGFVLEYVPHQGFAIGRQKTLWLKPFEVQEKMEKAKSFYEKFSWTEDELLLRKAPFGSIEIVPACESGLAANSLARIKEGKIVVPQQSQDHKYSFQKTDSEFLSARGWSKLESGKWIDSGDKIRVERMIHSLQYLQEEYYDQGKEWDMNVYFDAHPELYFRDYSNMHYVMNSMDRRDSIRSLFEYGIFGEEDLRFEHGEQINNLPQRAPDSERGRFKVRLLHTSEQAVNEAKDTMQKLGLVEELYSVVPQNLLGRPGEKARALHIDYLFTQNTLSLPKDMRVMHGMTGVSSHNQAIERLCNIIEAGGLKSIRDRRHAGLRVESLSPLGDIASAIDHGVSATIAQKPVYGNEYVIFVFRPEVLKRKRVWFAPKDFGGGEDRSKLYQNYACEFDADNQRFQDGICHAGREKHLEHITKNSCPENEVYFDGGIALSEIEEIMLEKDVYKRIKQSTKDWNLPDSIKITVFKQKHQ